MAWLRVILGTHLFEWLLVRVYILADTIHRRCDESTWRGRAEHIRKVSRIFERAFGEDFGFPVILGEAQTCYNCQSDIFLVVHPHRICDSCWLTIMGLVQEDLRTIYGWKCSVPSLE
jgi:hypothetical protein